jgi:hypothetical protein
MAPSPSILGAGKTKGRRSVEDYKTTGSGELWISSMPQDRGPEGNLKLWRDTEDVLDGLCKMYEFGDTERGGIEYEGVHQALVDVYNRAIEERRRCEDLLRLHRKWEGRRVGGVMEPTE